MEETDSGPQITHCFYKKEVASRFTILNRSAMGAGVKRNTNFQEALRRLQNMSPALPWTEVIPHMNAFSNMLRISGYNAFYRYQVINGAITRMQQVR